jgi:hypothetical protein
MAATQLNTIENPNQTKWQALSTWHSHCTAAKTKLLIHKSEFQTALLHTKSINTELEIFVHAHNKVISHAVKNAFLTPNIRCQTAGMAILQAMSNQM